MKRNMLFLILGICTVTVMAAACGKNPAVNTVSSGGAISGEVVSSGVVADRSASGGTISASAIGESSVQNEEDHGGITGKINLKNFRYANDRNIYEGDCDEGIYQYDLNGNEQCYYNLDMEIGGGEFSFTHPEVIWVDNEWVYISCHRKQQYYEFWRIPVNNQKTKKHLDMDKKEKLARTDRFEFLITKTDHEMIYFAGDTFLAEICRLDLKTKKIQKKQINTDSWGDDIFRAASGIPLIQDGKIFYNDDSKEKLYQFDLERWEASLVGMEAEGNVGADGTHLYFMSDDKLVKMNTDTGRREKLFSIEKLENKLYKNGLPGIDPEDDSVIYSNYIDSCYIENVFYYQNRLYLDLSVSCELTEDNEKDFEVMYSCSASDGSDIRYEKKVTEYLWQQIENSKKKPGPEKMGDFLYFINHYFVIYFHDKSSGYYDEFGDYDDDDDDYDDDEDDYEEQNNEEQNNEKQNIEEEYDEEEEYKEEDPDRFVIYDSKNGTFHEVKQNSNEYGLLKALGFPFYQEPSCL